jgi:rhodanese-related sulfurtransferase
MKRIIIDVREPGEFADDHVDGAINIPPAELMAGASALEGVPKDTELVLYCISGARSSATKNFLRSMGYTNVVNGINKDHVRAKYL